MKTRMWWIIGSALIGIALIWGVARSLSSGKPVEAVPAKLGPIREFVDERGKTRLPETYLITMPYPGRIESITLAEGVAVRKGQVVAQIVQLDLELDVKEATAVVDRLTEAIRENADVNVEKTALQQSLQFVESMSRTVEAAAARVKSGQAKFDYAEKNYGRIQKLFSTKAKTEDDLDQAYVDQVEAGVDYRQDQLVHQAMVALEAATNLMPTMVRQYIDRKKLSEAVLEKQKAEATARLRQVEEDERRGKMTSPVDGVVLERNTTNERYLAAGTTLLEIGRLEDLQVEADILSVDVVDAKVGDPVEIYGPAIGRPAASGTVQRIYPAGFTKISSLGVEQQRVKMIIAIDPDDLSRLRQERDLGVGYRVRVRIITAQRSKALVVPRSALFRGADGNWQVYAVRNGRARIESVKVGLINDELAEVTGGLAEGDLVVRAPESNLADGDRVESKTP